MPLFRFVARSIMACSEPDLAICSIRKANHLSNLRWRPDLPRLWTVPKATLADAKTHGTSEPRSYRPRDNLDSIERFASRVRWTPGGSTRGHAAGVGDVEIKDDKRRKVRLSTEDCGMVRTGQWKLVRTGRDIEINQVSDNGPLARSVQLVFNRRGAPREMLQMVDRRCGSIVIGSFRPWKKPR
jgi:hypothetical protein